MINICFFSLLNCARANLRANFLIETGHTILNPSAVRHELDKEITLFTYPKTFDKISATVAFYFYRRANFFFMDFYKFSFGRLLICGNKRAYNFTQIWQSVVKNLHTINIFIHNLKNFNCSTSVIN